jgi:hypothetical protein
MLLGLGNLAKSKPWHDNQTDQQLDQLFTQASQCICPSHGQKLQELVWMRSATWMDQLHTPDLPSDVQLAIQEASRLRFIGCRIKKLPFDNIEAYEIECPNQLQKLAEIIDMATVRISLAYTGLC